MNGWLKLHRKLLLSSTWKNSTASHKAVLITVLMNANHEEYEWWDKHKEKNLTLTPGSFTTSYRKLANQAEVSVKAVRNSLKRLEKQGFATVGAQKGYTLITVCNWTYYQKEGEWGTPGARQGVHEGVHKKEVRSKECKNKESTVSEKGYTDIFEEVWETLCKRGVKRKAFKCWNARIRDGFDADYLKRCAENYRSVCDNEQKDKKYMKHASTFFSRDLDFENYKEKVESEKERVRRVAREKRKQQEERDRKRTEERKRKREEEARRVKEVNEWWENKKKQASNNSTEDTNAN